MEKHQYKPQELGRFLVHSSFRQNITQWSQQNLWKKCELQLFSLEEEKGGTVISIFQRVRQGNKSPDVDYSDVNHTDSKST